MSLEMPILTNHCGLWVARDDLFPGGTKARFLHAAFSDCEELVYASPVQGGAQTALAHVAQRIGKRVTIFLADRAVPHDRELEARRLGAKVVKVRPGYLNVIQKRAADYVAATPGAKLLPFGGDIPEAFEILPPIMRAATPGWAPDEVWCAAGSGLLSRCLALAWPRARRYAVQVGRELYRDDVVGATIVHIKEPFDRAVSFALGDVRADPHYDAKALRECVKHFSIATKDAVLFWNVTGPANP